MNVPSDVFPAVGGGGQDDGGGRDRWLRRGAPIAAAAVLVLGIGFLVFRGTGSDSIETAPTDRGSVRTVVGPDDAVIVTTLPLSGTTAPAPTAPPLRETTTTSGTGISSDTTSSDTSVVSDTGAPDTTTTTAAVVAGGPNQAQLDAALLRVTDLDGDWTTETPDFDEVCPSNPEVENAVLQGSVLFQQLVDDPTGVRQISNSIYSFPDAATAESAFTADVAILEACTATTVDLNGVSYRVEVLSSAFDEEEATSFPCSEQNAFITVQLTNSGAAIPYIGQTTFSFRCGRNVGAVSITSTIGLDDLGNDNFFNGGPISDTRVAAMPGST